MDEVRIMDRSRLEKVNRLAGEALSLHGDARKQFLEEACLREPSLRSEVQQILDAHHRMGDFLEKPIVDCLSEWLGHGSKISGEAFIGPYKILEPLAEGGMGSVYLTERDTGSGKQKLALKVIRSGLANRETRARFASEHHALAHMDHPNLARLYEAGTTENDEPFFTMEYVPGQPISDFCKKHAMGLDERLDLFGQVCEGIRHAHQRGIIHRDLKPANVMAFFQDDQPVAKIIDFGIARAIGGRPLADLSIHTAQGSILGTPSYMSPEQVDSGGMEVDTRTDVYALGALLYELLTGVPPFEFTAKVSLGEMLHIIKEEDPPNPSRRLVQRRVSHKEDEIITAQQLEGDLNRIVMKALAKDCRLRYDSVSTLLSDMDAFRQGLPIAAGPPSSWYRLGKSIRRNRAVFAAGALVFLSLVLGLGLALLQTTRARQAQLVAEKEAARHQAVRIFLGKLLTLPIPRDANRDIKAVTLLDQAAALIDHEFGDDPLARSSVHEVIGASYESLGWYDKAHDHYEQNLATRREVLGAKHPDTLASMERVARILLRRKKYAEAEQYYKKTIELMRQELVEAHLYLLRARRGLADTLRRRNMPQEALVIYEDVIEKSGQSLGQNHEETQRAIQGKAYALKRLSRTDEAVDLIRKLLYNQQRYQGPNHPTTLSYMGTLADLFYDLGRYQEAKILYRDLIQRSRKMLGEGHLDTLSAQFGLMLVLQQTGRLEEAEAICRSVFKLRVQHLGELHPETLKARNSLGSLLIGLKRYEEAEFILSRDLERHRNVLGNADPKTLRVGNNLAHLYFELGQYQKALDLTKNLLLLASDAKEKSRVFLMATHAEALQKLGRFEEAANHFEDVVRIARNDLAKGSPFTAAFLCLFGECLTRLSRFEEAQAALIESYEALNTEPSSYLANTLTALIKLYDQWGKTNEVAKWSALIKEMGIKLESD